MNGPSYDQRQDFKLISHRTDIRIVSIESIRYYFIGFSVGLGVVYNSGVTAIRPITVALRRRFHDNPSIVFAFSLANDNTQLSQLNCPFCTSKTKTDRDLVH